jgi:DNA-binding transcriptional ArsR family regulator
MAKYRIDLDTFSVLVKALADPNRLRALTALRNHELCVCQVVELLKLAPSTVSKHMTILKQAGLVNSEKRGKWVFYRLPEEADSPAVRKTLDWVLDNVVDTEEIHQDDCRCRDILKIEPEVLCQMQSKGESVCC